MIATDRLFAGSIPETYDQLLVPLIFEFYARDLAERLATQPQYVLEIAAGTGVLTRALAARLPADARIIATDLNAPMLDYAKAQQSHDTRIEWKQADALELPFEAQQFDAVACQFGVMFFPNKAQAYREVIRVLKPGARFLFNTWDRISENEFADTVTRALASVFPQDPPLFMVRTPHGYHDIERIRDELKAAGFTSVSIAAVDAWSRASSPREAAFAYCQGTPLKNEIEARDASRMEDATNEAAVGLARRFGSGAINGRLRALVVSAVG